MYYIYPKLAIRVGFNLLSAGHKEIKQYSFEFFKVQCEYIKCSTSDKYAGKNPQVSHAGISGPAAFNQY